MQGKRLRLHIQAGCHPRGEDNEVPEKGEGTGTPASGELRSGHIRRQKSGGGKLSITN